jgi:SAM-dependent methyltransferase
VVGVDASTGMIKKARPVPAVPCPCFMPAVAERLPFADVVFDLVMITLSLSHWRDQAAGLAEVSRVMVPSATLLAADVLPARPPRSIRARARRRGPGLSSRLPELITASGLRVRHVEPIRSVVIVANATLIAAEKPRLRKESSAGEAVRQPLAPIAGPGQIPARPRPLADNDRNRRMPRTRLSLRLGRARASTQPAASGPCGE